MNKETLPANLKPLEGAIEQVLVQGDLAGLTPSQRITYVNTVCKSLGLNPLTQPFEYIRLNGKLKLYAKRDCAEQLRKLHSVSITDMECIAQDNVYCVKVRATDGSGRSDQSLGAVNIAGLKGEDLANAYMKAETKAKRRVTLSICGLGMLDELEVESIPNAKPLPNGADTIDTTFGDSAPDATPTVSADGAGSPVPQNGNGATDGAVAPSQEQHPAVRSAEVKAHILRNTKFSLNGVNYETAGITRDTFITLQDLARKYNKKRGKNAVKTLTRETFGLTTSLDLDEPKALLLIELLKMEPKVVTA